MFQTMKDKPNNDLKDLLEIRMLKMYSDKMRMLGICADKIKHC